MNFKKFAIESKLNYRDCNGSTNLYYNNIYIFFMITNYVDRVSNFLHFGGPYIPNILSS